MHHPSNGINAPDIEQVLKLNNQCATSNIGSASIVDRFFS